MDVSELFSSDMEMEFVRWMQSFPKPAQMFAAIPQLYEQLEKQHVAGVVEDGATIIGPVHVGFGTTIRTQCVVRGPAIIGDNVLMDSRVDIGPGTFIGSGCTVGSGSLINKSLCMNNARIGSRAVLLNSIVGASVRIGCSAIVGAMDADDSDDEQSDQTPQLRATLGDYAIIGAGSVVLAEAIVGPYTVVEPGVVLRGVYGPRLLVQLEQGLRKVQR